MKKINVGISIIVFIICLIETFTLLFNQKLNIIILLSYIYLLGIFFLSLKEKNWNKSLAKILIVTLYGVRMLVYPLLCIMNGNIEEIELYDTMNQSVMLQIYEYIVMIIFLSIVKTEYFVDKEFDFRKEKIFTNKLRIMMVVLFIFTGILLLKYPQFLQAYRPPIFISEEQEIIWKQTKNNIQNTMPLLVYYLGGWLIKIVRIIFAYYLIIKIKYWRFNEEEKKSSYFKIILSLIIALLPSIITTEDRAGSFFATLTLFLLIAQIYKDKIKKIIITTGSIAVVLAITILIIIPSIKKDRLTLEENNADKTINAYFSGSINIAAGLKMPTQQSKDYMIGDTFRYIPLVVAFFTDYKQSNELFNQVLAEDTVYNSQIMPNIIQGYFYFGYILSPIFSILLAYLALRAERNISKVKDTFGYVIYIYMAIFLSVGIILYYFSLTINLILQYALPMYVFYAIFRSGKKEKVK